MEEFPIHEFEESWRENEFVSKLDTMTKYPSIPTYLKLGKRSMLEDDPIDFGFDDCVYGFEKCDGANGRIVFTPCGYFIGSRDRFIAYEKDLECLVSENRDIDSIIIKELKPIAERLKDSMCNTDFVHSIYFEVYGGNIGPHRNYTLTGKTGAVMFDVFKIQICDLYEIIKFKIERIAGWRNNMGQTFLKVDDLFDFSSMYKVNLVPLIFITKGRDLPKNVVDTYQFLLYHIPKTLLYLDGNNEKPRGLPEGIIVRTINRSLIGKMRIPDCERTLRTFKK